MLTVIRLIYLFLGMSTLLASLKESEKSNPFIRFALKVREAWALRNYKRFFHFACGSDSVGSFETETSKLRGCQQILSWSLDRERKFALKAIFKTCVIGRSSFNNLFHLYFSYGAQVCFMHFGDKVRVVLVRSSLR